MTPGFGARGYSELEHFKIDRARAINPRSSATQACARRRGGLRLLPQSERITIKFSIQS